MSITIDEAIDQLTTLKKNAKYAEALEMAIKALKSPEDYSPLCYTCKHLDEPIDSEACDLCINYCCYEENGLLD